MLYRRYFFSVPACMHHITFDLNVSVGDTASSPFLFFLHLHTSLTSPSLPGAPPLPHPHCLSYPHCQDDFASKHSSLLSAVDRLLLLHRSLLRLSISSSSPLSTLSLYLSVSLALAALTTCCSSLRAARPGLYAGKWCEVGCLKRIL